MIVATTNKMPRRGRYAGQVLAALLLVTIWTFTTIGKVPVTRLPAVKLEYRKPSPYNDTKVALLIENRPQPVLAPLLLHMTSVVPDDWKVQFMGSDDSISLITRSPSIKSQVDIGKLDITYIPANLSTDGQEAISQVLTNLWFYETVLRPAEWLLLFQTDSIMCTNSDKDLNDWLDYDWVGAPWVENSGFGGNGGLSLRRVSSIIDILRNQQRMPDSEPEDVWLSSRLGHRPGAVLANGTLSGSFSAEMLHSSQKPMGYHIGGSGGFLHAGVWGTLDLRQEVYNYCPEIKMEVDMDTSAAIAADCARAEELRLAKEAEARERERFEYLRNQTESGGRAIEEVYRMHEEMREKEEEEVKEAEQRRKDLEREQERLDREFEEKGRESDEGDNSEDQLEEDGDGEGEGEFTDTLGKVTDEGSLRRP